MADRPPPRLLKVLRSARVTPAMRRITLGGEGLDGFPDGQAGGYIKLRLPSAERPLKPVIRTYTIRSQSASELEVDFAMHGQRQGDDMGPATQWAMTAQPGDAIEIAGPGPAKPLPEGMDFYLVAGDMAALPAISINLENLPADARGIAFLSVQSEDDIQPLIVPEGIELRWLIDPHPGANPQLLSNAMRKADWPEGDVYAWSAAEFSAMRELRSFLREEKGLGPDRLYISSYWKAGLTEEGHKLVKREDVEAG